MRLTADQQTYIMDYACNAYDEADDRGSFWKRQPDPELLEELREEVDWLSLNVEDEATEIRVREELRAMSLEELTAEARELFGVWIQP